MNGDRTTDVVVRFQDDCGNEGECRWAVYVGCDGDRFVAAWGPEYAVGVRVLDQTGPDAEEWRAIAVEQRNAEPDNDYAYPRRHRFGATGYEPAAPWRYEMDGSLDGVSRHCAGTAEVTAGTHSVSWQLLDTHCTGDSSADWLHADNKTATIVATHSGWTLESNIAAGGSCTPNVPRSAGAPPRDVRLHCTWCPGQMPACSGGASYRVWSSAGAPEQDPR